MDKVVAEAVQAREEVKQMQKARNHWECVAVFTEAEARLHRESSEQLQQQLVAKQRELDEQVAESQLQLLQSSKVIRSTIEQNVAMQEHLAASDSRNVQLQARVQQLQVEMQGVKGELRQCQVVLERQRSLRPARNFLQQRGAPPAAARR